VEGRLARGGPGRPEVDEFGDLGGSLGLHTGDYVGVHPHCPA
jgi:hypothetical protein